MRTIWKYRFPEGDETVLTMPMGAHVLTIQVQDGSPVLWALVDPDAPPEPRLFYVKGTGWVIDQPLGRYVGTVQLAGFVWHVFEAPA